MMADPIIIGADCDAPIRAGEEIDLRFYYKNEEGSAINLSTAAVSIVSASPDVIQAEAEVSVLDAASGVVRFLLGADASAALRPGTGNRFRLLVSFGAESNDVSPLIFIKVSE